MLKTVLLVARRIDEALAREKKTAARATAIFCSANGQLLPTGQCARLSPFAFPPSITGL
jgi:hypothetical protein